MESRISRTFDDRLVSTAPQIPEGVGCILVSFPCRYPFLVLSHLLAFAAVAVAAVAVAAAAAADAVAVAEAAAATVTA